MKRPVQDTWAYMGRVIHDTRHAQGHACCRSVHGHFPCMYGTKCVMLDKRIISAARSATGLPACHSPQPMLQIHTCMQIHT
eukprot:357436-Chlamydomonas_euryale.AAC.3